MSSPFVEAFLVLLAVYLVYSAWVGLDSRYPIGAAVALLVVAVVVDAAGNVGGANTLAEFAFWLLAGGLALVLVEHFRPRSRRAEGRGVGSGEGTAPGRETPEPADHRDGTP
jgi:ABC-type uncharacterized transport system permease subunit